MAEKSRVTFSSLKEVLAEASTGAANEEVVPTKVRKKGPPGRRYRKEIPEDPKKDLPRTILRKSPENAVASGDGGHEEAEPDALEI